MESFQIKNDIHVFGFEVTTFPDGIGEAFELLVKKVPGGFTRDYYGISYRNSGNKVVYVAAALEREDHEAERCQCERYIIEKGDYMTEMIPDWREKTKSIKIVFERIFHALEGSPTGPCVEWYKNNDEMLCMVKLA